MFIYFLCAVLIVYLDQLTKWLAIIFLEGRDSFPIIKDVLHLTYVENTGAAFGMFKDARWFFMILTTVAVIGLTVYLLKYKPESKWVRVGVVFIIGGGIGNMVDRILLGYVVDFIDFTLIDFAVFNVADSFVCVGAGILVVRTLILTIKEYKELKAEEAAKANAAAGGNLTETQSAEGGEMTETPDTENGEKSETPDTESDEKTETPDTESDEKTETSVTENGEKTETSDAGDGKKTDDDNNR